MAKMEERKKPSTNTGLVKETKLAKHTSKAVDKSSAEAAKKAMDEIDAIQHEKDGVPEDIEAKVKKQFLEVLSE